MVDDVRDTERLLNEAGAKLNDGIVDDDIDALMTRSKVRVGVSDVIQLGIVRMMSTILGLFGAVYFSFNRTRENSDESPKLNNEKKEN